MLEDHPEETRPADDAGQTRLPPVLAAAWPYALVLAVGLFVLLPRLGDFGFWDPWEPKYAESAREMVERGSYLVPYYREEVRLTKPILVYWGVLAGAAVFGLNEFGARIGGVSMAILAMLTVLYSVSRLRGRQAGLLASLVLGTCPLFYLLARQATPDVYLMTSLGCSLLLFCVGLFGPERRRDLHFGISYACFALAVLAKGPIVASAIFFTPLAIYMLARLDLPRLWEPDLRPATTRLLAAGIPSSLLLPVFGASAFLFGTSPIWWGWSTERRTEMVETRQQILLALERSRAAEVVLVLTGAVAAWMLVRLVRSGLPRGWARWTGTLVAAVSLGVAAGALFFAGSSLKVLVAAILGILACLAILIVALVRWLRQPALWETVQPLLRPVLRQVLLFAIVFFVVAGPWHLAIFVKQSHGYFTDFIVKHNIHRIGEKINSSGVSDFYMRTLIFGLFPWCAMIPIALASVVGWWDRNPLRRYGLEAYMLIATAATYVAFSCSITKFSYYLSPILIPLAVLIGLTLDRLIRTPHSRLFRLAALVAALFYVIPMIDLLRKAGTKYLVGVYTVKRYVPSDVAPGLEYRILLFLIAAILFACVVVRARVLIGALFLTSILLAHYTATIFIPRVSVHKSLKNLTETWKRLGPEDPIGFYGAMKHGIFFYTDYKVDLIKSEEEFHEFLDPASPAFCIVEKKRFPRLVATFTAQYPGGKLQVVDKSHFSFSLVTNRVVPASP